MISDDQMSEFLPFVHDIPPQQNKHNKGQWGRDWWVVAPSGDEGQDFFTGRAMARHMVDVLGVHTQYVFRQVLQAITEKGRYGDIEDGFLSEIGRLVGQKGGLAA